MDIVWVIIFMVVFYLVPLLLKSRQPKKYEYPDVPRRVPPPGGTPQTEVKSPEVLTTGLGQLPDRQVVQTPILPTEIPVSIDNSACWQGKLSQEVVLNGIVFAEILKPPKALRYKRK
ncbi:MAG: hypothetical protein H6Q73_1430 [Firmicutes bacterium]|nr:hypothetical protein [Bacillota bacterium]